MHYLLSYVHRVNATYSVELESLGPLLGQVVVALSPLVETFPQQIAAIFQFLIIDSRYRSITGCTCVRMYWLHLCVCVCVLAAPLYEYRLHLYVCVYRLHLFTCTGCTCVCVCVYWLHLFTGTGCTCVCVCVCVPAAPLYVYRLHLCVCTGCTSLRVPAAPVCVCSVLE